jgi:hypothetical protein
MIAVENSIISAALFIVMILLLLVVYDSNATMQAIVKKIRKSRGKDAGESHQEVTMEQEPIAGMMDQQVLSTEMQQPMAAAAPQPAVEEVQQTQSQQFIGQPVQANINQEVINAPSDDLGEKGNKPVGVKEWYMGFFRKILSKVTRKRKPKTAEVEISPETPASTNNVPQEDMTPIISALQSAIADLTNRVMQAELAVGKIEQLEGDITRATEETEMVSEEMRDILGTIRTSIDGLDGRVNQMSSEVQQLQVTQTSEPEIPTMGPS